MSATLQSLNPATDFGLAFILRYLLNVGMSAV
jgi:hypothetical protein